MFVQLSDSGLQEFVSGELHNDLFAGLSDSDLQDIPTRDLQDTTKIENIQSFDAMSLSPQSQLLTTGQRIAS